MAMFVFGVAVYFQTTSHGRVQLVAILPGIGKFLVWFHYRMV